MRHCLIYILLMMFANHASAQTAFFVDGFHGGIYGHYPLDWYTQYIIDQLEANPDWVIGMEIEPETWDSVEVRTPDAYRKLKPLMLSERIDVTNPTYAQPYMFNINGESIIRQFQYGMRSLRKHFPGITFSTYSSEEPCFTSQLPQLLRQFGFRYMSLKNPDTCWGGYTANFGGQTVRLTGPDGTTVIAVPRYACESLQPNSVWQTIAWRNSPQYLEACRKAGIGNPVGMCYQDAGWKHGPWLGEGRKDSRYVTWTEYISRYTDKEKATDHRFSQEDVLPGLMWGSQVMQRIARNVRRSENNILMAEKMSAIDFVEHGNKPCQTELDEAWRQLMLSQHHDSWIVPYNTFRIRGTWEKAIEAWTNTADSLSAKIINKAASHDTDNGFITLYNVTGQPRREVVSVRDKGQNTFVMADIPAFGHISISRPDAVPVTTKAFVGGKQSDDDACFIENEYWIIGFDLSRGGVVTRLIDRLTGKNLVASEAGEFRFGELRGFFPDEGRFCSSTETRAKATITTCGDLLTEIRLEGEINGTSFVKTVTLRKGSRIIDCSLNIGWQRNVRIGERVGSHRNASRTGFYDTRYMLSLFFPTGMKKARLNKDAPFDVCESKLSDTFFNDWRDIKHNVILHWADISDGDNGLALLTDHTTSYSYGEDYPLALTVQYSGPGLWGRDYPITGASELRYALIPHEGSWHDAGIQRLAETWRQPVIVRPGRVADKSLLETSCALSSVTVEDNGSMNIRLFNADSDDSRQTVTLDFPVSRAVVTDLNGEVQEELQVKNGKINLSIPRFGIRTVNLTLKK